MRDIIINAMKIYQSTDTLPYFPYQFDTNTQNMATYFEVTFLVEQKKYRYGFEYGQQHHL